MTDTIRKILNDLERVRENLLGLSEEIWLSPEPLSPRGISTKWS